jgi:hypothetical protein
MATHHGKDGSVKVGSNTVAEIQSWTLRVRNNPADDTAMGDSWETHLAGIGSWDGSVRCSWDETDTNGQEAMLQGASITLNLYPEGADSGDKYYTGTATITEIGIDTNRSNIVTREFNFRGNGALTYPGTV